LFRRQTHNAKARSNATLSKDVAHPLEKAKSALVQTLM
jgi:hypothetical protein